MKLRIVFLAACAIVLASCSDIFGVKNNRNVTLGRRLTTGESVACALTDDAKVYCWGVNSKYWEYGTPIGTRAGGVSPTSAIVPELASLSRGVGMHFCGIDADGQGVCWGRDGSGQLGRGQVLLDGNEAGAITGGMRWLDISVGRLTTCGLAADGMGYCWGLNQRGTVGAAQIPVNAQVDTPTRVDGLGTIKSISAGWTHACAIRANGEAWCWGSNGEGQLGTGVVDTNSHRSAERVIGGQVFDKIALGSRFGCALTPAGDAYCWGANFTGQLGDGSTTERTQPVAVAGGHKFTQIVASSGFATGTFGAPPGLDFGTYGHACALDTAGKAWCWGWNRDGQVGDGTSIDRAAPVAVAGGLTFDAISAGGAYTCAMKGSRAWCWGSNFSGQVGSGGAAGAYLTPQAVDSPFKGQ